MVERLIQTEKRRLAAINVDNNWSKETLANKVSGKIENIKLIPNITTKTTPFEAHFGRKPNTQTSNIVTHPNKKNLLYNNIRKFYLDKKVLRRPMLDQQAMWNFLDSEPNLDIQYNSDGESDTIPLARQIPAKRKQISPIKITPDKLSINFGDKTSVLINKRKQVARKTLMRKAPEPRGTLKPLWNIIPDGTLTDYTQTTISIDTHNRSNTRIRKSDLAIATETYEKSTPPPQLQEPKPRLIHFVAWKTVREYNRNREKTRKFCLEEKRQLQMRVTEQAAPGDDSTMDLVGSSNFQTHQQAGPSGKKQNPNTQKRRTERKRKALSPSKKTLWPSKNKTSTLEQKSKEAAIAQTRLTLARKRQQAKQKPHPLIHMDLSSLSNSKTIEIINLASDSSNSSPMRIVTSSSPKDFMTNPPRGFTLKSPSKSPKKNMDNVVEKIKATNKQQEAQIINDTDSDTDYANIITIKKADPPMTNTQDNIISQQDTTTPQPQHNSTPTQQDNQNQHQSAEHDSTSDIENEPQPSSTPTNNAPQPQDNITNTTHATKTLEQSPISSLNTEDMEELNKLISE